MANRHSNRMRGERTQIGGILRKDDSIGFGQGNDQSVDCRTSTRLSSEPRGSSDQLLGEAVEDVAHPQESVHGCIPTRLTGQAFHEDDRRDRRRPQPASAKHNLIAGSSLTAFGEKGEGSRVQQEHEVVSPPAENVASCR